MSYNFEYCIYDPTSTQTNIRFSQNHCVPNSVVTTVHELCPESNGQKFVYLTKYTGSEEVVVIPSEIEGIPVRAINCFSFKVHATIKEISIPKTVCFFHKNALNGCAGLEKINMVSPGEIHLPGETIRNCKKLFQNGTCTLAGHIFADPDYEGAVKYTIPEGVHTIASYAFACHRSLQEVTIPSSVRKIENFAFSNCKNLQKVIVCGSPTIKGETFMGCESLTDVIFERPIYQINSYIFAGCSSLKEISVPRGVKQIYGWFDGCKSIRNVELPETIEMIDHRAFANCRSLQYINLPESVKCISHGAFANCSSLQKVLVRSHDIIIEDGAFENCPSATLEAFPSVEKAVAATGLEYAIIESDPTNYTSRTCIYQDIPALVEKETEFALLAGDKKYSIAEKFSISFNMLSCATALRREYPQYDLYTAEKYYLTKEDVADRIIKEDPEMTTDAYFFAKPEIDSTAPWLTSSIFEQHQFFWQILCSVVIKPPILEEIVSRLPKDNEGMLREQEKVIIACSGVVDESTKICVLVATAISPTQIKIKSQQREFSFDELRKIEEDIFSTCPHLFADVFNIAAHFLAKPKVRKVHKQVVKASNEEVTNTRKQETETNLIFNSVIAAETFKGQTITSVVIPEGVTEIGPWVFKDCTDLVDIQLPSTLQKIGVGAFQNCSSLQSIVIPTGVFCIEDSAFSECIVLKTISLPPHLKKLADGLFQGCVELENIALPFELEHIGARAFSHCYKLNRIDIPETVKHIEYSAFSDCTSISEIQLPESLETLQGRIFKGCTMLQHVEIPKAISSVGKRLFLECSQLKAVTLSQNITKVGESAFEACTSLEEIILPDCVECIENNAFSDCSSLKKVTLPGSINKLGSNVFKGSNGVTVCFKGQPSCLKKAQKEGWKFIEIP